MASLPAALAYANLLSVLAPARRFSSVLASSQLLAIARISFNPRLPASSIMKSRALNAFSLYSPGLVCRPKPSVVPNANERTTLSPLATALSSWALTSSGVPLTPAAASIICQVL